MKTPPSIAGQPSWTLHADRVTAHLTRLGGLLGPVEFNLGHGRAIQPFSLAPWAHEKLDPTLPPILRALRGDFFCAPFGIDRGKPYNGQVTPPHGETCNAAWKLNTIRSAKGAHRLQAALETAFRPGRVTKEIILRDGETAIYQTHTLEGMTGPLTLGHHPMLKFPTRPGSGLISTSSFKFGLVFPEPLGVPAEGSYSALKPAARFTRLDRVPLALGGHTDLSQFPARKGYDDLVQLATRPATPFAWTAVSFPAEGYVWFSLKNPEILNSTLLWISNGGRYPAPWSGRHTGVMGIEEICGYFDMGVAGSLGNNPMAAVGHPTTLRKADAPLSIPFIMAVAAVPQDFGRVETIRPCPGGIELYSTHARPVHVPLDVSHLHPTTGRA
jgi:hypothetical protein